MSELTLTLIKLGFLALLWMFVLSVLSVIRSDLFGAKVTGRAVQAAAAPAPPPKPAKKKRGQPGGGRDRRIHQDRPYDAEPGQVGQKLDDPVARLRRADRRRPGPPQQRGLRLRRPVPTAARRRDG